MTHKLQVVLENGIFYLTSFINWRKIILNYSSIILSTLYIFCSCQHIDSRTKSATIIKPELITSSWQNSLCMHLRCIVLLGSMSQRRLQTEKHSGFPVLPAYQNMQWEIALFTRKTIHHAGRSYRLWFLLDIKGIFSKKLLPQEQNALKIIRQF